MNKVLPVFEIWLWIAAISSEKDCCHKQAPTNQPHRDIQCNGTLKCTSTCVDRQLHIQCEDNNDMELIYNGLPVVLNGIFCSTVWDNTMPTAKCDCDTICENNNDGEATAFTTSKATLDTTVTLLPTNGEAKTTTCPNSTTVAVLGALVGLLVVLLAIVSTFLVWTCRNMRIKREMKITSEQLSGDQLVNPTYVGDEVLSLQPRPTMPAYETIPLHHKDGATLELLEQDGSGYSVLSRKQNNNTQESTVKMDEDNNEESYSKLELTVNHNGTREDSQDSDYGKLETLNIESDMTRKDMITGEDVHKAARNESDKVHERSADNVNSEEGTHEMENCNYDSETDKGEEKIWPLVAGGSDTLNISEHLGVNPNQPQETNQLMNELVVEISPQGDS